MMYLSLLAFSLLFSLNVFAVQPNFYMCSTAGLDGEIKDTSNTDLQFSVKNGKPVEIVLNGKDLSDQVASIETTSAGKQFNFKVSKTKTFSFFIHSIDFQSCCTYGKFTGLLIRKVYSPSAEDKNVIVTNSYSEAMPCFVKVRRE